MSISSTTDRVTYSGNGSTTAFAFAYKFFSNSDLVVKTKVNSTGVETTQTITTHYTVTGAGEDAGGTVTFVTAPASGVTVIIIRDMAATNDMSLTENGKVPSDTLVEQTDRLTMLAQRSKNQIARSVKLPDGFTATFNPNLPAIMVNDGFLKTDSTGAGFEYIEQQDLINLVNTSSAEFTADRALQSDSDGIPEASNVTSTELGYLSGVTSAVQTQITAKAPSANPTFTGTITTPLTASRAVVTGASSELAVSATTSTQIGYLAGATSAISGNSQSAALQNKTLDNTNTITVRDDRLTIQDNSDNTKQVAFEASGITTGTTRTFTMPDVSSTLAVLAGTQTFTGAKTFENISVSTAALNLLVGQIGFPSSQNASSGSNTLDDYEEFSWTPAITASSAPTLGYTAQVGSGIKIGQLVLLIGRITLSSLSGGSGTLNITGLPFTTINTTSVFGGGYVVFKENWTTNGPTVLRAPANSTTITGLSIHNATNMTDLSVSNLSSTSDMIFLFLYRASA